MQVITIVWTIAIISLPQAQSDQQYETTVGLINIATTVLRDCVANCGNPKLLSSVKHAQQGKAATAGEKGKPDYVSVAQSISNRLASETGRERSWETNETTEDECVEVHTVLTFTFMIFKTLRVDKEEVKMMTESKINGEKGDSDEAFARKFFVQKKELIKKNLGKVGTEGRVVLDVGYGVCVKRPNLLNLWGATLVDACFVFYTTDDLLPLLVKSIPRGGGIFHPKTTLYITEKVLKRQQDVEAVLFENTTPLFEDYKSVTYQVIRDKSLKPCEINRIADGRAVEKTGKLISVRWDLLCQSNRRYASYGFATFTRKGVQYLEIISATHKLVNEHYEMPMSKEEFIAMTQGKQVADCSIAAIAPVPDSPTPTATAQVTGSTLTEAEPVTASTTPRTAPALVSTMAMAPVEAPASEIPFRQKRNFEPDQRNKLSLP